MKEITSNWAEFAVKEEGMIIMGDDGKTATRGQEYLSQYFLEG